MEKPVIATNIDDLLIKHEAFTKPHKAWFERAIKKTGDKSLEKWIGRDNYFIGVNKAMDKIMPNASKEEKTFQARKWYQEDVIKYIKENPKVIKKENIQKIMKLKRRYKLILLTSNSQDYIHKIIKIAKLEKIWDGIISSKTQEEPEKEKLIKEFIKKYGKPEYYITGKSDESINSSIKKLEIKIIGINNLKKL